MNTTNTVFSKGTSKSSPMGQPMLQRPVGSLAGQCIHFPLSFEIWSRYSNSAWLLFKPKVRVEYVFPLDHVFNLLTSLWFCAKWEKVLRPLCLWWVKTKWQSSRGVTNTKFRHCISLLFYQPYHCNKANWSFQNSLVYQYLTLQSLKVPLWAANSYTETFTRGFLSDGSINLQQKTNHKRFGSLLRNMI